MSLLDILTFLLPRKISERELTFHTELVFRLYREFYETLVTTGYRDLTALSILRKRTQYSRSLLHPRQRWFLTRFERRVKDLKIVTDPTILAAMLECP